jgi:hypothetical protein
MQRVLSGELWKEVRALARKTRQRKAAIAYVTEDLVGFRKADVLVTDASPRTISCGETDATLLRKLSKKGVEIHDCPDLHAKVLLLGDVAVIGSGNMSKSSADRMVEAGVVTNHRSTVSAVASLIEQLIESSSQITAKRIATLCKIKVVRRGGRPAGDGGKRRTKISRLGNRTWLVGVRELIRPPAPTEQRMIDKAKSELRRRFNDEEEDFDWIKWGTRDRFAKTCRQGDSVIQILKLRHAKRPTVFRAAPVLLKQRTKRWTRFYLGEPVGRHRELPWGAFQRLVKELGYPRRVSAGISRLLEPDMADAIERKWRSASKR